MMPDELNVPFQDFVGIFERLRIPYALIGGLAVGVHGIPRPTHDLDFTIAVDRSRLSEFFQAVIELSYDVPQEFTTGWVDQVAGMPLIKARQWVAGKTIDVDVFLAESRFQKSLIQRRIQIRVLPRRHHLIGRSLRERHHNNLRPGTLLDVLPKLVR